MRAERRAAATHTTTRTPARRGGRGRWPGWACTAWSTGRRWPPAVLGAAAHGAAGALPGFGAFLAVALHKPLDAVTVMTLAATGPKGSWARRRPRLANGLFAAVGPAGAVGFYLLAGAVPAGGAVTGAAMAVSAGAFLCIALSDLLPELEFHSHDRFKLSAALLLGAAVAAGVEVFAHGHAHGAVESGPTHEHAHGHPHEH